MGEGINEYLSKGEYLKALERQQKSQRRVYKIFVIENNIAKHFTCLDKKMMARQHARIDTMLTEEAGVIAFSYGKYNKSNNSWKFSLRLEKHLRTDVDYFICVALDDIFEGIMHVWKLPSAKYKNRTVTVIRNIDEVLKELDQYEMSDSDIL